MKKYKVAILAGGKGTRLSSHTVNIPKPMVPILGKPILEHQINLCKRHGFFDIVLLVHHLYESIVDYFGDGSALGVNILYSIEREPRGTAGALRDALHLLDETFIVIYGDTFMDVDLGKLWNSHKKSNCNGTLFLHPNSHPHDSDLIEIDSNGYVRAILPYPHTDDRESRNLVNAALYVLERNGIENVIPANGKFDIAKDLFPRMLDLGLRYFGYLSVEYIKDLGTPERLKKVENEIILGISENLSCRNLRKAVFLDRDGTVIKNINHLNSPNDVQLLQGVGDAIKKINNSGILSLIVTNQPVVARGEVTFDELDKIHARLDRLLGENGAFVDRIYYCPHHPDKGFYGEISSLKVDCLCRKPKPGLLLKAVRDLNINVSESWMIGDTTTDIEAGRLAGVRTILLRTGLAGNDGKVAVKPDYVFCDFNEAVNWILSGHENSKMQLSRIAITICRSLKFLFVGGLAYSGKSFTAQLLKEICTFFGRKVHVISFDAWLKPSNEWKTGEDIINRYDIQSILDVITKINNLKVREVFEEPLHQKEKKFDQLLKLRHFIGPDDLVIFEGAPALMIKEISDLPNSKKIYVDIFSEIRTKRFFSDYLWQGFTVDEIKEIFNLREVDEVPVVMKSRDSADFICLGHVL